MIVFDKSFQLSAMCARKAYRGTYQKRTNTLANWADTVPFLIKLCEYEPMFIHRKHLLSFPSNKSSLNLFPKFSKIS